MIENLDFHPFPGLASPHLQTLLGTFSWGGEAPPSRQKIVSLGDGDALSCEISTPPDWDVGDKSLILVHGLGGSHASNYMVRLSRRFYQAGHRVVRINLRGSGSGRSHAQLPYHGGASLDVLKVLKQIKNETPASELVLIGFSLGGNIALKLAGEMDESPDLLKHVIAVCPPIDLSNTVERLSLKSNLLYHRYFLNLLRPTAKKWATNYSTIANMYDFDSHVTAKIWGFKNADDYYRYSSSCYCLPTIRPPCQILFAKDDPVIDHQCIFNTSLSPSTKVYLSNKGGHLGFIGQTPKRRMTFWLDSILEKWVAKI
ncbi:MAG: alpha/beta fold hydrolase [Parachlamydia sp.]|jgi:hypothetical protein|nr:alpha/beta fold hydrolase [Parachlamydia sp.]